MSPRTFINWMAFYAIEPFGEVRGDMRSALVASVIANVNRDKKKKSTPFKLTDFMLFEIDPSKLKSGDREVFDPNQGLLNKVIALNTLFGGTFKDERQ